VDTLRIVANDQGNTGTGGALYVTNTVAISIAAINDAPVNSVPGPQIVNEGMGLVFSTTNNNAISLGDFDAGTNAVRMSLSAAHGTLTLNGTAGLAFEDGTTNGQAAVKIAGRLADINLSLEGLSYQPNPSYSGPDTLTITSNDLGNSGAGGALSDTDMVTITVAVSTPRIVRAGNGSGLPGGIAVPIELISQGNENAIGFSLMFDQTALTFNSAILGSGAGGAGLNVNISQAGNGRVGLLAGLPAGQVFTAGTQQVVVARFIIPVNGTATSTVIGFGDQPIARQVSDTSAQSLAANFQGGVVSITAGSGYESDVAPRPFGNNNGTVSITDWVQSGRFAAGLDTITNTSEFQRVDCAPRLSGTNLVLGNGVISITDWVQAGRYAAGLDPVTPAGGPDGTAAVVKKSVTQSSSIQSAGSLRGAARTLRLVQSLAPGREDLLGDLDARQRLPAVNRYVRMELEAQGDENAMGFSVTFNPAALEFTEARLDGEMNGATVLLNRTQLGAGRLGLAVALAPGQTLALGRRMVVELGFLSQGGRGAFTTRLGFRDEPVRREMVNVLADALAADYTGAEVFISGAGASTAVGEAPFSLEVLPIHAEGGMKLRLAGEIGVRYRIEVSEDLATWRELRTVTLDGNSFDFAGDALKNARQQFYRALPAP
jgi:hypothetical protein